ncbi:nuclear RNA export factor 1 [Leptinotarsa decemlineata]|uniref:nuclear RNA export factor 1 n=1 Tax=Leptinotarsa decemlineata TaxID=7539 RepID=UPI003D30B8B0
MPRQHGNRQDTWVQKDDRYSRADRDRRVTFKQNNRHGGKNKGRDWSGALREHLQDEDIDMGFSAGSSKTNRYNNGGRKGRKGSPMPTGNVKRKLLEGPTNWYRVSLPHGDKYEKNFLLKLFVDKLAPLPFWPIAWQVYGSTVMFYVDDFKVAEKLFNLSRTVQMPNGFNLIIRVHPGCPNVDMTPSVKEKMKLVMAKRYNDVTKALDLTKFHADPDLQDCFCALFKPIVLLAVIDIIAENIPQLEALNLQDNRIQLLNFAKKVSKKIPNLKILHIGNNKVREISELDSLQGLPIVELVLDGNPLCDKFRDQPSYISEVRKRFPKCLKLDGQDLPPPISFDIVEEHHLPAPCPMYLCHEDGNVIVRQFLQQYFQIYDSDNRQPLLQAYHEHASFSFTMGYPYGYGKEKNVPWLNWYQTDNRNLLRVQDSDRRFKLLKQGQLAVVSFLQDMPNTKHDMHSFTADLTLFTPLMLCLTVTGMFKELKGSQKNPPLRYFFRTLVIVPAGTGFCISNEVLYVTNATPDQSVEAFKTPINVITPPQPAPAASISSPGPSVPVIVPSIPDDAMKQEMVKQMSLQSGMNLEWSLKCLEETQWDYQKASLVFQKLNSEGIVPPEAFVK